MNHTLTLPPPRRTLRDGLVALEQLNLTTGLCGASVAFVANRAVGGADTGGAMLGAACLTAASYAVDRLKDGDHARNALSFSTRAAAASALGATALAVPLAYGRPGLALGVLAFPASVYLYTASITLRGKTLRLKEIPGFKNTYTAACWSALTVWAAAWDAHASVTAALPVAALMFFAMWSLAVLCDLRDVVDDAARGVPTVPVRLGRERAASVASAVAVVSAGVGVALAHLAVTPSWVAGVFALDALAVVLAARVLRDSSRDGALANALIEASVITWGPIALALQTALR
jgi:4-hydroxybenzoate polyprenyltransferase